VSNSGFQFSATSSSLPIHKIKVGIAVATWNQHITSILLDGAKETLLSIGLSAEQILIANVPGAFELPLAAQWLFNHSSNPVDAVICLGCVIKGDTPHFDYVCMGATQGIMSVGLAQNKPCIFGVITTNTEQQAFDRAGGILGNKGSDAAQTALELLQLQFTTLTNKN